jgi:SAM-dependent methyltransferase
MKPPLFRLRARWRVEQYDPGWFGLAVNPFYFARRGLRRELQPLLSQLNGEVLDVGCGRKPYRDLVPAARYVGLDVDTPTTRALGGVDVFYDGGVFPFPDASFDGAICSQVLEHVFTPEEFLAEIHRVLRPDGRLVLTVPFVWDEHEQPRDFARYSSFGLRALLERNGFVVESHRRSVADSRVLFQLAAAYVFKATLARKLWLTLAVQFGVIAPINLAGAALGGLLPANLDLYLDNIVLARRTTAS